MAKDRAKGKKEEKKEERMIRKRGKRRNQVFLIGKGERIGIEAKPQADLPLLSLSFSLSLDRQNG